MRVAALLLLTMAAGCKTTIVDLSDGATPTATPLPAECLLPGAICSLGATGIGDGGNVGLATFGHPVALAGDSAGVLYVGDTLLNRVRRIESNGTISTYAGNGLPGATDTNVDAISTHAADINGLAACDDGWVHLVKVYGDTIHGVDPSNGHMVTVAGRPTRPCSTRRSTSTALPPSRAIPRARTSFGSSTTGTRSSAR